MCLSPTPNGSTVLQRFECGNVMYVLPILLSFNIGVPRPQSHGLHVPDALHTCARAPLDDSGSLATSPTDELKGVKRCSQNSQTQICYFFLCML